MKIIGLTGGIASGKSEVAAELAKLGASVLDADEAAHEVIDSPSVQDTLVERWGKSILAPDGRIDRGQIARIVFSDEENAKNELRFLEETLHPVIRQQFEAKLSELRTQGGKVAVIDAPLLLEAGWQGLCDFVLFVDSPESDRLERAIRRNWTEAEFSKRENCQMPINEKRSRSTHILDNSGTLASLRDQVHDFWAAIDAL